MWEGTDACCMHLSAENLLLELLQEKGFHANESRFHLQCGQSSVDEKPHTRPPLAVQAHKVAAFLPGPPVWACPLDVLDLRSGLSIKYICNCVLPNFKPDCDNWSGWDQSW